jgi:hypothetical protein
MKELIPLQFNLEQCRAEVEDLRQLLLGQDELEERQTILPFLKNHHQLLALIGQYHPDTIRCNRLAWEYDLFGDFQCDFVMGNAERRAYTFVECEDAKAKSIFVRSTRSARDWAPRFEHGFSQIIDWFYKINDMLRTDDMANRFGGPVIEYTGVLLIGRDKHFQPGERRRLEWRNAHVVVNSKHIYCRTYDELLLDLETRLAAFG